MKNTATLKAALAALAIASMSPSLVAEAQSNQVKIQVKNLRHDQRTVTISAKQSDNTIVQKGTLKPRRTTSMGDWEYDVQQFTFNRTDTIIADIGNNGVRCEKAISRLQLKTPSRPMLPDGRFSISDKSCELINIQNIIQKGKSQFSPG